MQRAANWAIAAVSLFALSGCGSSDDSSKKTDTGVLEPPAIGVQLASSGFTLEPGGEQYECWSFQVPADAALSVTEIQQQIPSVGLHHYAVFTSSAPYDAANAGPYECFSMGIDWGLVSGGGVGTPGVKFPEGAGMPIKAGQHIILQLHLLNATNDSLEVPSARINLVGAANPESLAQVGLLIAGTLDITLPAKTSDVAVKGGCVLEEPLNNIFAAFPHMHQLGRRISTEIVPTTGARTTITDETWDFGDQGLYPASGSAAVGDTIETTCYFDNTTPQDVHFGLKTGDEMCVEVLYHYPATTPSKYCGLF